MTWIPNRMGHLKIYQTFLQKTCHLLELDKATTVMKNILLNQDWPVVSPVSNQGWPVVVMLREMKLMLIPLLLMGKRQWNPSWLLMMRTANLVLKSA